MSTGYTHAVQTGEMTDLCEFAMRCTRAFGTLILMRDDPMNAPIPDKFAPSDYHDKALKEARERITWLKELTEEQRELQAFRAYEEATRQYMEIVECQAVERVRYEAMLARVHAWSCPPECSGLKNFMVEQLNSSIESDCRPYLDAPERLTGDIWLARECKSAECALSYHAKERAAEIDRTEEQNRWLVALRSSLM